MNGKGDTRRKAFISDAEYTARYIKVYGKECPNCHEGKVRYTKGVSPYSVAHYQCDKCKATYTLDDIEKEQL